MHANAFRTRAAVILVESAATLLRGTEPLPLVINRLIHDLEGYRSGAHVDDMIDEATCQHGREHAIDRMMSAGFVEPDAELMVDARIAEAGRDEED